MNNEIVKHKFIQIVQDHYNPLCVCRSLGEVGIKPIVILYGDKPCMLNHSKYPLIVHQVKTLEEGYDLLINQYGHEDYKPFILCSDDTTQSYLDLHYDELIDHFIFYHATEKGRVTWLQNKDNITNLGLSVGLEVPKKEVVNTGVLPQTLNYPVITKVLASTMGAWKGDVFICSNEFELKDAYTKIQSPKLCVQEYIKKKGEFCMEGFSINDGKDVFMPYITEYLRFYDNSYGHYMVFTRFLESDFKEKILKLFRETKYNGIFEIEFMKGPNDENYFLEINFRASTWNYALTVAGGNLPYYWALSTILGRIPYDQIKLDDEPFKAMVEPEDFINNVLKLKTVSLSQWIKEVKGCKCHYYYDKNDSKPFYHYLLMRLSRPLMKKLGLKTHR